MANHSVTKARKGQELARCMEKQGCIRKRQSGSHEIWELPDGSIEIIPTGHTKELGRGLREKIVKKLLAAGLTILVVATLAIPTLL